MESLAIVVQTILLVMLALSLAMLVLCLLARLGKVPPVVGYVALGVAALETLLGYLMSPVIGSTALVVFAGCLLLTFIPSARSRK
jgi:hypothetical protein